MTTNETITGWTTWSSVRGMGPIRATEEEAYADLEEDGRGCASQGGYSDRDVYRIDEDGYVVDEAGGNVWPYGRTSAALRVEMQS